MSSSPVTRQRGGGAARARRGEARSSPSTSPGGVADRPPLRLAGRAEAAPARAEASIHRTADPAGRVSPAGEAIASPTDPRWVLAVRTAEQLEGDLLTPEKRQRLVRTGRVMGLTPFDCNLVIAIVQDQARRGHAAAYCPAAGEAQLRMVPLPRRATVLASVRRRPMFVATVLVATVLLVELMLLRWFF